MHLKTSIWSGARCFVGATLSALCVALVTPPTVARAADAPPANSGYLVFSLGPATRASATSLVLEYAATDRDMHDEVTWNTLWPVPNDYDNGNGDRGIVYAAALQPGSYRIYRAFENDSSYVIGWPVSIDFTITTGRVTYAGAYSFVTQLQNSSFGLPRETVLFFRFSEQDTRDVALAARKLKLPELTTMPVDRVALSPVEMDSPPFCVVHEPDPTRSPYFPICSARSTKNSNLPFYDRP